MNHPSLPSTTHTIELAQLAELNDYLTHSATQATASRLGLEGARTLPHTNERGNLELPGSAVLDRLTWTGPPEYPYIHAHFGPGDTPTVEMHTAALQELSRFCGLRHSWG